MSDSSKHLKLIVDARSDGDRIDLFISEKTDLSRSFAQKLIEAGNVLVNSKKIKSAAKVAEGSVVEIIVPPPAEPRAKAEKIPLDVLYEDSHIIVVNKPAGMVVHPACGHYSGTLVNALLAHCKDLSGIGGELRAGIVHRLDAGTSGVMVIAKSDEAHKDLSDQFKARDVEKEYIAVIVGSPKMDSGSFDSAIGRSVRDRKKFSAKTRKGRNALTFWTVTERLGEVSVVSVRIKTGRTHQIRVHFSEANMPLVGDATYGGKRKAGAIKNKLVQADAAKFERPALHSAHLRFTHPITKEEIEFKAPVPKDMKSLIAKIRVAIKKSELRSK